MFSPKQCLQDYDTKRVNQNPFSCLLGWNPNLNNCEPKAMLSKQQGQILHWTPEKITQHPDTEIHNIRKEAECHGKSSKMRPELRSPWHDLSRGLLCILPSFPQQEAKLWKKLIPLRSPSWLPWGTLSWNRHLLSPAVRSELKWL